jgi:hypothetical protein
VTTAAEALELARQHHVAVSVNGDKLRVEASQKPPAEVLNALRSHKSEIIATLAEADTGPHMAGNPDPASSPLATIVALYERRTHQEPGRRRHFYRIAAVSALNLFPLDNLRGNRTCCGQCKKAATDYLCVGDRLYWVCGPICRDRTRAALWAQARKILGAYGIQG